MAAARVVAADLKKCAIRDDLLAYFCGWDLSRSAIFNDKIRFFLMFDHQYITEPHLFLSLLKHEESSLYIGSLPVIFDNSVEAGPSTGLCFYVARETPIAEIMEAFTALPESGDDGAIQYYVRSGFVIPSRPCWAIWFSTYWELAICGFRDTSAADEFLSRHVELRFLTNADVIAKYAGNPRSGAASRLAHICRGNILESH